MCVSDRLEGQEKIYRGLQLVRVQTILNIVHMHYITINLWLIDAILNYLIAIALPSSLIIN